MNLPAVWQRILSAREPRLTILLTVHPFGLDPFPAFPHLALQAGALRYATEPDTHVSTDHGALPFWPWLMDWPLVERRIAPQDRRAEITQVTARVQGGAGLGDVLLGRGGHRGATARIDLWSSGLTLDQAIPIFAGTVTAATINERMGAVELTINEAPAERSTDLDPGTITLEDFPEAPAWVVGKGRRSVLIGGPHRDVVCPQISATECYVCDGIAADPPRVIKRDGAVLREDIPTVAVGETAVSRTPYTKLVFADAETLAEGNNLHHTITASEITGYPNASAINYLLDVEQIKATRQAQALFDSTPIKLSALIGQSGDALTYLRDQLIPQTDLAFSFKFGRAHAYKLNAAQPRMALGIGYGLLHRMEGQDAESVIYNQIDVRAGRQFDEAPAGSPPYLVRTLRDKANGDDRIKDICARSEARYGPRALVFEARDVAVDLDESQYFRSSAAEILADILAEMHALPWRLHRYKAAWLEGMAAELNQTCVLTDLDERLDDTPARLVGHAITPTGPELTFATQLDPTTIDPGEARRLSGVL